MRATSTSAPTASRSARSACAWPPRPSSTSWPASRASTCASAGAAGRASRSRPGAGATSRSTSGRRLRRPDSALALLGLRDDADVGPRLLPLAEDLLGLLVVDRAGDDHVVALLPLGRRGHLVLGGELQRVDDPEHLVEVRPVVMG